jgi:DNA-binding MarR family transcriptional regulator
MLALKSMVAPANSSMVQSPDLPLPTLISHVLVAFTIEFDNEFERQVPHRITNHDPADGPQRGPWLVSMAMWVKFMQFIPDDGIAVRDLQRRTRLTREEMRWWLTRMGKWWGYLVVEPGLTIRPTAGGRRALEVWRPLSSLTEKRWQDRFGSGEIGQLRHAALGIVSQLSDGLPDCLPILGYGLFSKGPDPEASTMAPPDMRDISSLPLPALLSRVLLAFALDFERESDLSLAVCANLLRVLDERGVPVRELPRLSGVSKEAIDMAMGVLLKAHLVSVERQPSKVRSKLARLTSSGRKAQDRYRKRLAGVEKQWRDRFGRDAIQALRVALQRLIGAPDKAGSPAFRPPSPYPNGWRASVPEPSTLPYYPMQLHRGGYPDGS